MIVKLIFENTKRDFTLIIKYEKIDFCYIVRNEIFALDTFSGRGRLKYFMDFIEDLIIGGTIWLMVVHFRERVNRIWKHCCSFC